MKPVKEPSAEAESETPGEEKPLPLDPGNCESVAEGELGCTGAGGAWGASAGSTNFVEKNWVNSPAG